jgi:hypothetical protein
MLNLMDYVGYIVHLELRDRGPICGVLAVVVEDKDNKYVIAQRYATTLIDPHVEIIKHSEISEFYPVKKYVPLGANS